MTTTPWLDPPESPELSNEQINYVEGLHRLADFLREHPEFIEGSFTSGFVVDKFIYGDDAVEQLAEHAKTLGTVEKDALGDAYFILRRRFGPHAIEVNAPRSKVCERRVVGTEEIPERVVEAHTREIVEWDCNPILGR